MKYHNPKRLRAAICLALAASMALGTPLEVFAYTWDISKGDVTITAGTEKEDGTITGQMVSGTLADGQTDASGNTISGSKTDLEDDNPIITGRSQSTGRDNTSKTVTVQKGTDEGADDAQFTLKDATLSGKNSGVEIELKSGTDTTIKVSGENNKVEGSIHVNGDADLTIKDDGDRETTDKLIVDGDWGSNNNNAAIGTKEDEDLTGSISIEGSVNVDAVSAGGGAAIGTGSGGEITKANGDTEGGKISISTSGTVDAKVGTQTGGWRGTASNQAAAIGTGKGGSIEEGGSIEISGSGTVNASGVDNNYEGSGAGIGTGEGGSITGSINISGSGTVNATADEGAGIGTGEDGGITEGASININKDETAGASNKATVSGTSTGDGAGIGTGEASDTSSTKNDLAGSINIGGTGNVTGTSGTDDSYDANATGKDTPNNNDTGNGKGSGAGIGTGKGGDITATGEIDISISGGSVTGESKGGDRISTGGSGTVYNATTGKDETVYYYKGQNGGAGIGTGYGGVMKGSEDGNSGAQINITTSGENATVTGRAGDPADDSDIVKNNANAGGGKGAGIGTGGIGSISGNGDGVTSIEQGASININAQSGTISGYAGGEGAGIGGGATAYAGDGGTISQIQGEINVTTGEKGTVHAENDDDTGAGIGSGSYSGIGANGKINITGSGLVDVQGGKWAAGIGTGDAAGGLSCTLLGLIKIDLTSTGTLFVTSGTEKQIERGIDIEGAAIGTGQGGKIGASGKIEITGSGTVIADAYMGAAIGTGKDGGMDEGSQILIGGSGLVKAISYGGVTTSGEKVGGAGVGTGNAAAMNGTITIGSADSAADAPKVKLIAEGTHGAADIGAGDRGTMNGTVNLYRNATIDLIEADTNTETETSIGDARIGSGNDEKDNPLNGTGTVTIECGTSINKYTITRGTLMKGDKNAHEEVLTDNALTAKWVFGVSGEERTDSSSARVVLSNIDWSSSTATDTTSAGTFKYVKGVSNKAHKHVSQTVEAVAATCTTAGITAGTKCEVCNQVLSGCETIAALGHDWENAPVTYIWTKDGDAWNCTASQTCQRNGCSETRTAAAKVTHGDPAVKCTEEVTMTWCVTNFDKDWASAIAAGTQTTTVAQIGHDWGNVQYSDLIPDGNTYKATATITCQRDGCGETITETASVAKQETNCTSGDSIDYTVSFTGTDFPEEHKPVSSKTYTVALTEEDKPHAWSLGGVTYTEDEDHDRHYTVTLACANNHEHDKTAEIEITPTEEPATCTKDGTRTYTGTFTGTDDWAIQPATINDSATITKLGHSYESEQTKAPTCSEKGVMTHTCVHGDDTYTTDIPIDSNAHNWGETTYEWSSDYKTCTATHVCKLNKNHVETELVDATDTVTTATCTQDGNIHYVATFKATWATQQTTDVKINATGHQCDKEVITAATCTTPATVKYTCRNCDYTATVQEGDVDKDNHSWGEVKYTWSDDLTKCTATRVCKLDSSHVQTETVYTTAAKTKDPTDGESGETTYTATFTVDWATEQTKTEQNIPAEGHVYAWQVTKKPTCAAEGEEKEVCMKCGEVKDTRTINIDPEAHDWDNDPASIHYEWTKEGDIWYCTATHYCKNDRGHAESAKVEASSKVTKEPTHDTKGETTYTATYTATFSEAWAKTQKRTEQDIEPLAHLYESKILENATCTKKGKIQYTCANCGDSYTESIPIDSEAHQWGKVKYTWSEDLSECTATRVCTLNSAHKETETVESTDTQTLPTCTHNGETVYTATFKADWSKPQTEKQVHEKTSTGHLWAHSVEVTYTEDANHVRTYTATLACKHDAAHNKTATLVITPVNKAPTCTEAGSYTYTGTFADTSSWVLQPAAISDMVTIESDPDAHAWGAVDYHWSYNGTAWECTATQTCTLDSAHTRSCIATVTSDEPAAKCCEDVTKTWSVASFSESWAIPADAGTRTTTIAANENLHTWHIAGYNWLDDGSDGKKCIATLQCTNDGCTAKLEVEGSVVSGTTDSTCQERAVTDYTAYFTTPAGITLNERWQPQYLTEYGGTYGDHAWGEWTVTKQPTCTEAGEQEHICNVCGQKETQALSAPGHSWGEWAEDTSYESYTLARYVRECQRGCGEKEELYRLKSAGAPSSELSADEAAEELFIITDPAVPDTFMLGDKSYTLWFECLDHTANDGKGGVSPHSAIAVSTDVVVASTDEELPLSNTKFRSTLDQLPTMQQELGLTRVIFEACGTAYAFDLAKIESTCMGTYYSVMYNEHGVAVLTGDEGGVLYGTPVTDYLTLWFECTDHTESEEDKVVPHTVAISGTTVTVSSTDASVPLESTRFTSTLAELPLLRRLGIEQVVFETRGVRYAFNVEDIAACKGTYYTVTYKNGKATLRGDEGGEAEGIRL